MATDTVGDPIAALRELLPVEFQAEFDKLVYASKALWERRDVTEREIQQLYERWFALGVAVGMANSEMN